MSLSKAPNRLIHSTSPYLLQHAHNPVQWHPWGMEALNMAKYEDKPMIISIGYSACHWCHVMERESFENKEIAKEMNNGFVCIKVDREERPDVDQIYMEALQAMGINGGWPLNVFAMPDQKPFYGGTYFSPKQWLHILKSIREAYQNKREDLKTSSVAFAKTLNVTDSEKYGLVDFEISPNIDGLRQMVCSMKNHFDLKWGGLKSAPKFPNPVIWKFLLASNGIIKDFEIQNHIDHTLRHMANGGIYDHLGGGFSRYSVDERWFAPHFEKMLYDKGQMLSLYAAAYQVKKNPQFKALVYESIAFVEREMMSPEYGFYAALDADSEGEEGTFYVWENKEIEHLLGEEADLIKQFYNVEKEGNWDRGLNILYTKQSPKDFAESHKIDVDVFLEVLSRSKTSLLQIRDKRVRPGLDDKMLTSWNAIMLKGLIDAYLTFGEESFLKLAEQNASFIQKNLVKDNVLMRSFSNDSTMGFLDDYAFTIEAFYFLYQATFQMKWLNLAIDLTEITIDRFYDSNEKLFYYNDVNAEKLIARKKEIFDNVIPASNSVMAQNLYFLGNLFDNQEYLDISKTMLSKIAPMIKADSQYLSNWGMLYAFNAQPIAEIAVVGKDYLSYALEIQKHFIPNKIVVADSRPNSLPLLKNRNAINGKTTIYVCFNKSCKLPVHSIEEAIQLLKKRNN